MRRLPAILALGAVLALSAAPVAARQEAGPQMIESSPGDGSEVHRAPSEVRFSFSEPLDPSSTIEVRDACGRRADPGTTNVELNEMSTPLAMKPSGRYVATYKAVGMGGVTGTEEGSISFTVHMGPSCDGSSGGHGNHGKKEHGRHGEGGSSDHPTHRSGSGGAHTQDDHSSGGHNPSSHAAAEHSSGGHGGHGLAGKKKQGHGAHKGRGGHGAHKARGGSGGRTDTLAGPGQVPPADGETVALALGFSVLLGAGGGILVRLGVRL